MTGRKFKIIIKGNPVPKPRMNYKSRWLYKRYWAWVNEIRSEVYRLLIPRVRKIQLIVTAYVAGYKRVDIKNIVAGIEDAIKAGKWVDGINFIGVVPDDQIDNIEWHHAKGLRLCDMCPHYNKSRCDLGKIRDCPKAKTEVEITVLQ